MTSLTAINGISYPNVRIVSPLRPDAAEYRFDVGAQRALRAAEDRHFWFKARCELIGARLGRLGVHPPAHVVELGCGAGAVCAYLARLGYRLTGVEGHPLLVSVAARRCPGSQFIVHDLTLGVDGLGLERADAVGLFDVIEHVDDPARIIRSALALVRTGGWVVGTVPALMRLWTDVDRISGHRRRFERDELMALLRAAGCSKPEVSSFNRVLLPLLRCQREHLERSRGDVAAENVRIPPPPLNAALLALLRLEQALSPLLDRVSSLAGPSLWFACQRSAATDGPAEESP